MNPLSPFLRVLLPLFVSSTLMAESDVTHYVDPRIGSEGVGRTFVGPSMPYGMVKPSPDCTTSTNSGWLPMPAQVNGFGQVHVSGTGGGPKYGNVLVMPFCGELVSSSHPDLRASETIELGLYSTLLKESGIQVDVTTSDRASYYRFVYPEEQKQRSLSVDAGFFLGEGDKPDGREAQQFVGSEIQVLGDSAVSGYTRIRGGWNNGRAYTVYFYAIADRPFAKARTWHCNPRYHKEGVQEVVSDERSQADHGQKTGALLQWSNGGSDTLQLKVGISFTGILKAKENAEREITDWSFTHTRQRLLDRWQSLLSRVEMTAPYQPDSLVRMFYTALYHSMIMPVDRTGENPEWNDPDTPYYDDFYAIWDTYRTSTPLITILDPERQTDIVRSLINIYQRDGYMPDARSGNSNGRTQGGSNADIVIADALAKGLGLPESTANSGNNSGHASAVIDYKLALDAMLHDATVPPGGNEEAEGRGGLLPYLQLGYVPYGIPRAGTRTVEYSFCDWAIAQVAQHLGHTDLVERYTRQSASWRNLWRQDYTNDGTQGFILPRASDGQWLDHLPFGHSMLQPVTFDYNPTVSYEGPWYVAWWDCFFYEASSWEYSLSVPHDVPGLIQMCGGPEAFERRLDTFFDHGYYNVSNEPSFLSPCLYHWLGKPERTSQRVHQIINRHYKATPAGIPGNDDSGAMSSWLAFHMLGLYPNAGHDYYLLHAPVLPQTTLHLTNGRDVRIITRRVKGRSPSQVLFNGQPLPDWRITHQQLLQGGDLVFELAADLPQPANVIRTRCYTEAKPVTEARLEPQTPAPTHRISFSLHGQTRRFNVSFTPSADGDIRLDWGIQRNLDYWTGSYTMTSQALDSAASLCYQQPVWGQHLTLHESTFCLLSRQALQQARSQGVCRFSNTDWQVIDRAEGLIHLRDTNEGAEMWVRDDAALPLIWRMQNNPVEINWEVSSL